MPATYNPTALTTDIVSYARLRFRDVGRLSGATAPYTVGVPLLLDEEYQGLVDVAGPQEGLAQAAESLASTFAQKVSKYAESGGIAIEWPKRAEFYAELARSIRLNGVGDFGAGYGNGIYGNTTALPTPETDARMALL